MSIGIPLDLSMPTEMTCIEPLVENEKSSKTPNKLKSILCYILDLVFTYSRCKVRQIHKIHVRGMIQNNVDFCRGFYTDKTNVNKII